RPKANASAYYNRESFYSINFLCAVDSYSKFKHISFGFGSFHDSRIFRNSNLRSYCEYPDSLGLHVVGDSAFRSFVEVKTPSIVDSNDVDDAVSKQRVLVE
ncbi:putative nuclease HARBI1, partial [Tubulinosema ratisbonensis]